MTATNGFLEFLANPWTANHWEPAFGDRPDLQKELTLLGHVFPASWLEAAFVAPFRLCPGPFRHQLPYHLMAVAGLGGRTRLLKAAAELLRHVEAGALIPFGRLRNARLYPPMMSELLVGPLLRQVGVLTWQPEGPRHGADFRMDDGASALVAEVKRVWTAERQKAIAMKRVSARLQDAPAHQGPVFTTAEEHMNKREDARRLYPRVRHAAEQLAASAQRASPADRRLADRIPGIVCLDLEGNSLLTNLDDRIQEWMTLGWARSIDLVMFFDHVGWDGTWDTVARCAFSRTGRAWTALVQALGECSKGHLHLLRRAGQCTLPLL